MIDRETAIAVLSSVVSLCGLWCLYWWAYRSYRVDRLRYELFVLRNQLFDDTDAGIIRFSDPVYGLLRTTLNGFLRFAHTVSFSRIGLLMLLSSDARSPEPDGSGFHERWKQATQGLSPEAAGLAEDYLKRMHVVLVKHILLSSPLLAFSLATVVVPLVVFTLWKLLLDRLLAALKWPLETIDSVAVALGR
jgi:hypothetical protein